MTVLATSGSSACAAAARSQTKERLIAAGASESIFDAVNCQLAKHGFMARGGQMIDASFVQVPKQSMDKEEKAIIAQDAMPADWKPAKRRQKDTDARWTKKHGKSYFGYKLSANADKGYVDGGREARLRAQGWRMRRVPVSNMCSPDWRKWAARSCALPPPGWWSSSRSFKRLNFR